MTARPSMALLLLLAVHTALAEGQTLPTPPPLAWRYNAGAPIEAAPAATTSFVACTTRKGYVALLNPAGHRLWTATVLDGTNGPATLEASPLLVRNAVIVATREGHLVSLALTNGAVQWDYDSQGSFHAPPIPDPSAAEPSERLIAISQPDGAIHCVRAGDGAPAWRTEGASRCDAQLASDGTMLLYGNCDAALYMVAADGGATLGKIPLCEDCQVAGGTTVLEGVAYLGTRSGKVYAIGTANRTILWTNSAPTAETFTTPAVDETRVAIGSNDGLVYAIARADGKLLWKFPAPDPKGALLRGPLCIVAAGGSLFGLRAEDGTLLWKRTVGDDITPPVLAGNLLLVGSSDGSLSAYAVSEKP
jgi:outer membrane protein assembly factor BamB